MNQINLMDLHHFWFGEIKIENSYYRKKVNQWFMGLDPLFDQTCLERFSSWLDEMCLTDTFIQNLSSREFISLIILYDQIPRNSFRGNVRAYAYDSVAQKLCLSALGTQRETELTFPEKMFLYMPLEHAESKELQSLNVKNFAQLHAEAPDEIKVWTLLALEKALEHQRTIEQVGRFPKRKV